MTKPETKEQHTSSILCKCPSCIRKAEMGYAQALTDVEKTFNIGKPFMISSETLFQRIQALKEKTK